MPDESRARLTLVRALLLGAAPESADAWRAAAALAAFYSVLEGFRAAIVADLASAPEDVRDTLDDARADAAVRGALGLRSAVLLCAAAPGAIVVKGTALLAAGFVAAGERHASDVDVLVTRDHAIPATRALERAGHQLQAHPRHDGKIRAGHEWPGSVWFAPGGGIVDLHIVASTTFATDHRPTPFGDVRIPAPGPLALGLAHHFEHHHEGDGRGVLRHTLDLRAIQRSEPCLMLSEVAGDRHVERGLARLEVLTNAARRRDASSIDELLRPDPRPPTWQHLARACRQVARIARHDRALIPWLFFPHPRYMRAARADLRASSLAQAYVRRLAGR